MVDGVVIPSLPTNGISVVSGIIAVGVVPNTEPLFEEEGETFLRTDKKACERLFVKNHVPITASNNIVDVSFKVIPPKQPLNIHYRRYRKQ